MACGSITIGIHAIVTKGIPDYAITVGDPPRVIKMLDKSKFEDNKD